MRPDDAVREHSVIRLEGVLDGIVARRVEAMLTRAKPGARLDLDLTQVREFHDFGIAVLGHALTHTPAQVTLRGLRQHHIRVLRYFGIETASLEGAATTDVA
jgi:anti-anti-sigma regulatory factor